MSKNDQSPTDLAAEMAMITMQFINMVTFFASPHVVAASGEIPSREHILSHIDQFLSLLTVQGANLSGPGSQSLTNTLPHARALRDLVAAWAP